MSATLSPWQAANGWPSDAYFDAVAAACEQRGIVFTGRFRDEPWDAEFPLANRCYVDGPMGDWPDLTIRWLVGEADDPTHTEDFIPRGPIATGWSWLAEDGDITSQDWFPNLPYLADPADVADAVVAFLATGWTDGEQR